MQKHYAYAYKHAHTSIMTTSHTHTHTQSNGIYAKCLKKHKNIEFPVFQAE